MQSNWYVVQERPYIPLLSYSILFFGTPVFKKLDIVVVVPNVTHKLLFLKK